MADVYGDTRSVEVALKETADWSGNEISRRWFSRSQEILQRRGTNHDYEFQSVLQSGIPPQWDPEEEAWVFEYPHHASPFFEWGTPEHEITPKKAEVLVFPWPDIPADAKNSDWYRDMERMWEDPDHWLEEPEVILPRADHPGQPAIAFVRDSRDEIVIRRF